MRDIYTNTEHQAGRYEAAHADHERPWRYEPDNNNAPLPIDDATRAAVRAAYVNAELMFPCGGCGEVLWSKEAREVHRERRHGA